MTTKAPASVAVQSSGNQGFHPRTVFYLLLILFACAATPLSAQQTLVEAPSRASGPQTFTNVDWFERELGDGVVWRHYLFDDLDGLKQSISYIEADLSNPNVSVEFPYLANARQRVSTMVPNQVPQAKAAINGSYFDTEPGGGGHVTYLRVNSSVVPLGGDLWASAWGYEGAIALNGSGAASILEIPGGGWSQNVTHPDILACGPIVTLNGSVPATELNAIGAHCTARHPRSAVGLTNDNRLILFAVDGRTNMSSGMTCEELGIAMQELGCEDAMNLDGGGSTTLWGAGEQYSGVLNFPSDNGAFDHEGERACSNAISIISQAPTPAIWDAQLTQKTFSNFMENGTAQVVTLEYKNVGTGTWTDADTMVVLARPDTRTSVFQDGSWVSATQPATMSPPTVGPGQTATFTFTLQAPTLVANALYDEHFMLTRSGVGRIGPADSEAWMSISVQLPVEPKADFIVESRPGGHNSAWYSDSGMADTPVHCTAPGLSDSIGSRYGSTYRSVAGSKQAVVAPDFPEDGFYNVYVAWPAGSSRRSPVTYHIEQPGSVFTVQLDQTATANEWVQIGTAPFMFEEGHSGSVVMTNEDIDVSGNMFASAVKFEYVPKDAPEKSYEVIHLSPADPKPVIDGMLGIGEWDAASPAAQGFVRHDTPATPATEDGGYRMLYDDTNLYIQFSMPNSHLPSYTAPSNPYGFSNLAGDTIDFFLTPGGVLRQRFYRIMLSPNPSNGICYVWSQASLTKTTNANTGTDWSQRSGAVFTHDGSQLVVEYMIPWAEFNYAGLEFPTRPDDGEVWGVQAAISNNLSGSTWEYVNWEPDPTGSFVYGEPFGELKFVMPTTSVESWPLY